MNSRAQPQSSRRLRFLRQSESLNVSIKPEQNVFFCSLVDRHRMVNEALSEELSTGLHALSIVAKTEEQWRKMVDDGRAAVEGSPQCRGGFGK